MPQGARRDCDSAAIIVSGHVDSIAEREEIFHPTVLQAMLSDLQKSLQQLRTLLAGGEQAKIGVMLGYKDREDYLLIIAGLGDILVRFRQPERQLGIVGSASFLAASDAENEYLPAIRTFRLRCLQEVCLGTREKVESEVSVPFPSNLLSGSLTLAAFAKKLAG